MSEIESTLNFAGLLAGFLLINYLVFSWGGHWFFYRFLKESIEHRKILEKNPTNEQLRKEKRHSFQTQIVFFIMGLGLYGLYRQGLTRIYLNWDERGVIYFIFSFFLIHQLHDAYFYWTHRWMHEWNWLKTFHRTHHESSTPTPFSALSFHPIEAMIHGLYWYVIAFLFPIPVHWVFGFYSFMFYINMWGHTSYEFWHRDLLTHPLLKILNTPTHHNLHHKYHQANYGIYYNFWDKLCGTNHPDYENHYRAVKKRTEETKSSRIMKLMKL